MTGAETSVATFQFEKLLTTFGRSPFGVLRAIDNPVFYSAERTLVSLFRSLNEERMMGLAVVIDDPVAITTFIF